MFNFSWKMAQRPLKFLRRIIVLIIGSTIVLIGIAMIILPGPATVVIPAGLAILSIEFIWARNLLIRAKEMVQKGIHQVRSGSSKIPPANPDFSQAAAASKKSASGAGGSGDPPGRKT